MSDSSISRFEGEEWALEEDDDRYEKKEEKKLTPEQEQAIGLGDTKVLLSSDGMYELHRDKDAAYIYDKMLSKWYTLRFEDIARKGKDYYPRFKVKIKDVQAIDGGLFFEGLRPTGIWDSIDLNATTGVYLSRLSIAMRGVSIRWERYADEKVKLEVDHKDQCCANDHYSNLEVVTKSDHLKRERIRDREAVTRRTDARETQWTIEDVQSRVEELLLGPDLGEEERTVEGTPLSELVKLLEWLDSHGKLSQDNQQMLLLMKNFRW